MDRESRVVSRRQFMQVAAFSTGALVTGSASLLTGCARSLTAPTDNREVDLLRRGTTTRNALHVPPTVSPSGLALNAQPATVSLGGSVNSNVWAYNHEFPGPSIRARRGDAASIQLLNGLSQETITHWHGLIVDDRNDGHPRFAVPPGGSYAYSFAVDQRAALYWYHPHPHMLTGEQVCRGLAGAFIVNDTEEAGLGLPSGGREVPLIIRDASLDRAGNLQYTSKSGGFLGNTPLVNGTLNPMLGVDTALYRFRILNGANARIFGLGLSNGAPLVLIGNDGGLLQASVSVSAIDLAPGERADVLVDFRSYPVGTQIMLQDGRAGWDLLQFEVTRSIGDATSIPGSLSTVVPLSAPMTTRDFSFDGMSKINGKVYNLSRIDFRVPLGVTERWRFSTNGNAPHPVHVHGASFQVISRTGGRGRLFPWEAGWKDTVLLEDGESVEILIRFERFRGIYLLHCHKLEHEDMGMMSNFEVV